MTGVTLRTTAALALAVALGLSGCGTSSDTAEVGGTRIESSTASGGLSAPGVSIGGTAGVVTLAPAPDPAQELFGPWTLARSGDTVCTVDLGSRNAVGDYSAKTRRCSSVELARIALWTPSAGGLTLYDFERRPVVALRQVGPNLYEGSTSGGMRVTLWR